MKHLEKEKLKTLLNIIGTTPSHQIAHFTQGGEALIEGIYEYCKQQGYRYQIYCTNGDFYDKFKDKYNSSKTTHVMNFPLQRKVYKIQAREFNVLFVSSIIEEEERNDFLKKSHKIIRSSGNIIIFIPKKDYRIRDNWVASLEDNLYVSTSITDDLFEHYDVIISRKMHGWGN